MKYYMKRLLITIFITLIQISISAQTIVADYQNWNPSSPPCNLFGSSTNVPITINGNASTLAHLTNIGQPSYDAVTRSVNLDCSFAVNSAVSQGTQYQIAYAFQFGYSYQIIINAAVINSTNTGGNASAVFNLNSGGNGNNFACSGKQNISNTTSGNLIRGQVIQSNNFTDYTLS